MKNLEKVDNNEININKIIKQAIIILGILSSLATFYSIYYSQKKVSLSFDIISKTNVLDINADLVDLDILYKNQSLKKEKKNLKLILLRVKNTGTEDILKNFYDDKDPLSIKPINGTIVEKPEISPSSNQYFRKSIKITLDSTGKAIFSQVIIDKKSFFIIKLLILTNKDKEPNLEINGKIAGINDKFTINYIEPPIELSFFKQVFFGNVWIQIVKTFIYSAILSMVFLFMIIIIINITNYWDKIKRRRTVQKFIKSTNYKHKRIDNVIFETYKSGLDSELLIAYNLLQEKKDINERYKSLKSKLIRGEEINSIHSHQDAKLNLQDDQDDDDMFSTTGELLEDMENLILDGYVTKEDDKLIINKNLKETLCDFVAFSHLNK